MLWETVGNSFQSRNPPKKKKKKTCNITKCNVENNNNLVSWDGVGPTKPNCHSKKEKWWYEGWYAIKQRKQTNSLEVKLATVVKGDPKASFSIASTSRCRGVPDSILLIASLYSWYVLYNAEFWAGRHQVPFFESLVWLEQGLNPGLLDHWRTLLSLVQWPGLGIMVIAAGNGHNDPSSILDWGCST